MVKGGEVIVENGKLEQDFPGRTLYVAPAWEAGIEPLIKEHFERYYTLAFENYPVQDDYLPQSEVIPCT